MDNREIDRAIAEKFLGWRIVEDFNHWYFGDNPTNWGVNYFRPTDRADACEVVLDEIERRGWDWKWWRKDFPISGSNYGFAIWNSEKMLAQSISKDNRYVAVCEAALQAASGETS